MIPIGTYVEALWATGDTTGHRGWVAKSRPEGSDRDYLIELEGSHDGHGQADPRYVPKRANKYWWVEDVAILNRQDPTPPQVTYRVNKSSDSIRIGDVHIEAVDEKT